MARIYLSSTFADLEPFRRQVYAALRAMHHDVVSMEDYVAGDRRPLDTCVGDVATCQLYVGIFAHRYGFVPPTGNPERKSITELEYRTASDAGIKRLIFLVDPNVAWPPPFMDQVAGDDRGVRIKSLRDELSLAHTVKFFRTPDELATQVSTAVADVQREWTEASIAQARAERESPAAGRARTRRRIAGQQIMDIGDQFRGRHKEQRQLKSHLSDASTRIVSVIGRAGIGKTALVSKVLRGIEPGHARATPDATEVDGIVYLSTRTSGISLDRLFRECAALMDDEAAAAVTKAWASPQLSLDEKIERLLAVLDDGLYFILLDHFEDLLDGHGRITDGDLGRFLERSLAAPHGARLLVTSRTPLKFDATTMRFDKRVALMDGLSPAEGAAMLRELDPNGVLRLRDSSDAELAPAVERLHGVPRALEVLAGIKKDKPLRTLQSILDGFYRETVVDDLIREGYRRLEVEERRLIDVLAIFGCPVPIAAVEFAIAPFCPGLNAEAVVARLMDIYMVTVDPSATLLSVNPIDQDYALGDLPPSGDYSRPALHLRAAMYYTRLQTPPDTWRTIQDVEPFVREFDHRFQAGDFDGAARALTGVDMLFVSPRANLQTFESRLRQLDGRLQDPHLKARHLHALGICVAFLGPLESALSYMEEARTLASNVGDEALAWQATSWLSEVNRRLGRVDDAVVLAREALRVSKERSVPLEPYIRALSLALSYKGEFREAIECFQPLLDAATRTEDVELEGHVHDGLSLAYLGLGRPDVALEHVRRGIACYEEVGSHDPLGYVFNVKGMAHMALGRLDEAREALERGWRLGSEDANVRLQGFCLFNLARLQRIRNDRDETVRLAESACSLLTRMGATEGRAASAFRDALRAAERGDETAEFRALLATGLASIHTPDLYDPTDLLLEVERRALSANLPDLASEARTHLSLLERRRAEPPADV